MSGILKPMIHTTNATVNPSSMVNADKVVAVEKLDTPDVPNYSGTPGYKIVFIMDAGSRNGAPSEIVWDYADDDTTRDADYLLVLNTISAVVA